MLVVDPKSLDGYTSIQQAINNASNGDIIIVKPGVYRESIVVNKSISIIGEDRANTIIYGDGEQTAVYIKANNVLVRNLTIQNGLVGVILAKHIEGNMVIDNLIVSNLYYGVYGDRSGANNTIANNNISFNGWQGIFLYASGPCTIENNSVVSNKADGVLVRYVKNTLIQNNYVFNNSGCGIYLLSDEDPERPSGLSKNNIFRYNHVLNNSCGIKIRHVGIDTSFANNEVYGNHIAYNMFGLNLSGSNGNIFYNNNFIANLKQLSVANTSGNSWDAGYYIGGNFWSDHKSADIFWGPEQSCIGSDGVFDVPYRVSSDSSEFDRYPFTSESGWIIAPKISIIYPKNATFRSNNLPLVFNLNKPAYVSYSLDGYSNVTVTGNVMLSHLTVGQHKITVYANDVSGNVAFEEATFFITFPADVNMDGTVDILDVCVIAFSFGSRYGSPRWNYNADLNCDGKIDIVDVMIVAKSMLKG
jgi:parallel beta-helix repeat protein